jgi:hypothetical protein
MSIPRWSAGVYTGPYKHPDGEFLKYEDVKATLSEIISRIPEQKFDGQIWMGADYSKKDLLKDLRSIFEESSL